MCCFNIPTLHGNDWDNIKKQISHVCCFGWRLVKHIVSRIDLVNLRLAGVWGVSFGIIIRIIHHILVARKGDGVKKIKKTHSRRFNRKGVPSLPGPFFPPEFARIWWIWGILGGSLPEVIFQILLFVTNVHRSWVLSRHY